MDQQKRKGVLQWKNNLSVPFVIVAIVGLLLLTLTFSIMIGSIISTQTHGYIDQQVFKLSFLAFLVIQVGANAALLFIMFSVMHKSIGAFPRLEQILDKIIAGNYSLRLNLRLKDDPGLMSLVNKFNQVLEILEKKSKGQ